MATKPKVCPEDHKHEATTVCHDHHKCRCRWCVSEARARYQEKNGNGIWIKEELVIEVEHLLLSGMSPQMVEEALGVSRESMKVQMRKADRQDLSDKLGIKQN